MGQKPGIFSRVIGGSLGKILDAPVPENVDLSTPEAIERFYRNIGAGWPMIFEAMDTVLESHYSKYVVGDPGKVIPEIQDALLIFWVREGWIPSWADDDEKEEEEEEREDEDNGDDDEIPIWEAMLGEYKRKDPTEHKLALLNAVALYVIWKKFPEYFPDGYIPIAEDALMGMPKE